MTQQKGTKSRISYLDSTRGLCLFWMIVAHSLSIAEVPPAGWVSYLYPAGWATTCFVMLSGFGIALFTFSRPGQEAKMGAKWKERGIKIAIIGYLSNFFFSLSRDISAKGASFLVLRDDFLMMSPWTLSAILFPTAALLIVSPFLIRISKKQNPWVIFGLSTLLNLLVWVLEMGALPAFRENLFFQALFVFENPLTEFPMLLLFLLGLWSFSLGVLWAKKNSLKLKVLGRAALVVLWTISFADLLPSFLLYPLRFGTALLMGIVISEFSIFKPLGSLFGLLGRSSLLVFIGHRIFLHMERTAFLRLGMKETPLVVGLILSTVGLSLLMCLTKENDPKLSERLRRLGF